jgi:DNA-directed RNA polymerase subunit beta
MKEHIFLDEWKKNFYNKSVKLSHFDMVDSSFSCPEGTRFMSKNKTQVQTIDTLTHSKNRFLVNKATNSVSTSIEKDFVDFHASPSIINPIIQGNIQRFSGIGSFFPTREGNSGLKIMQYNLQSYNRSNQDTCMVHRPAVSEGQWVQKGDLLADCSASLGGELALGQNIFVAYMPWEGYNYEDAILISQRLVYDDIYTSIHIERYEIETRETKFGIEEITRQIPEIDKSEIEHLDKRGIIKIGTWVEEGKILVGKVTPTNKKYHSPYQKLLYTILEKEFLPTRDSSLRAPKGLKAKVIDIQILNSDFHMTLSSNLEKFKYLEKASLEKSVHSSRQGKETGLIIQKQYKIKSSSYRKWFMFPNLDQKFVKTPKTLNSTLFKKLNSNLKKDIASFFDNSEKNTKINLISTRMLKEKSRFPLTLDESAAYHVLPNHATKNDLTSYFSQMNSTKRQYQRFSGNSSMISSNKKSIQAVHIYLAEKRKIQMGDKMAGRHGNKGIVSQVLPRQDMPYLPDGTPIDMVLNPLGVPSRMNVGQIYECLLGLAGKYLGEYFRIAPFDEIYGAEASRSLVYSKLYEVRKKTGSKWIFNTNNPGKMYLYDGRTGESFDQAITVGQAYMLKLVHLVDDKIHARSTGPYSLVTQQPLRGRSKQGGQRLGEMEVWALEGYGAAFTLLEMLTIKSDDMTGRITLWSNIILNKEIYIGTPESFKVLVCELQALCLDIGLFRFDSKGFLKQVEHLMKLP